MNEDQRKRLEAISNEIGAITTEVSAAYYSLPMYLRHGEQGERMWVVLLHLDYVQTHLGRAMERP